MACVHVPMSCCDLTDLLYVLALPYRSPLTDSLASGLAGSQSVELAVPAPLRDRLKTEMQWKSRVVSHGPRMSLRGKLGTKEIFNGGRARQGLIVWAPHARQGTLRLNQLAVIYHRRSSVCRLVYPAFGLFVGRWVASTVGRMD